MHDARRDDLVRLTQDLIRIPTLNPPGRHYRDICDYLQARLAPQGWDCRLVRATGAAAGIAVVSAICGAEDPEAAARALA